MLFSYIWPILFQMILSYYKTQINNMKLKPYLLALLLPLLATAQLTNNEFDSIYVQLSRKSIETGYIGNKNGQTNPFDETFRRKAEILSNDDLVYISLNGDPVLKAAASTELVNRKSNRLTEVFSKQILTDDRVTVHTGDLSYNYGLAASLYKAVASQKEKMQRKAYYEKTSTEAQLRGLKELFGKDFESKWTIKEADSLLNSLTQIVLSNDNMQAETLGQIFRANEFKDTNYKRVKYFANKYPTPEILATLASFRNKNDLPLLRRHMDQGYLAISRFPDPSFFPDLKSRLNTDYDNPEFQEAIAAYRSKESKTILESICKKIVMTNRAGFSKDECLFRLHSIIEKINCPLYNDILLHLEKTI